MRRVCMSNAEPAEAFHVTYLSCCPSCPELPVSVVFGMTINRSQGQTKKRVAVCLTNPVFSHGQLHVPSGYTIAGIELFGGPTTRNVVYPEILH